MRDSLLVVFACASLIACMPASDPAHIPIFLPPPYAALPAAPPGAPIEPGRPVSLNARQQQAVVVSEMKWMKDAASVQFRERAQYGGQLGRLPAIRWRADGTG